MTREVDTDTQAQFEASKLITIFLVEIETADATVRAWSGIGDFVWNGNTFKGTGIYGGFAPIEEASDNSARGTTYQLSGIPEDVVSASIAEIRQGKEARLYIATLNDNGVLIGEPLLLHRGFTDVPELEDDAATATIRITSESAAIDQQRPRILRYTTEDQKTIDPDDRGFEYVEALQDRKITWGRS